MRCTIFTSNINLINDPSKFFTAHFVGFFIGFIVSFHLHTFILQSHNLLKQGRKKMWYFSFRKTLPIFWKGNFILLSPLVFICIYFEKKKKGKKFENNNNIAGFDPGTSAFIAFLHPVL